MTVIIANSLRHGAHAGLLNVAGTQLGLALMMAILVVGLSSVIAAMGWLFEWLRWAGAAYLVWIGWKLLRSPDSLQDGEKRVAAAWRGFILQGSLVLMANPKALLWFGAFIPQFVDPMRQVRGADHPVLRITADMRGLRRQACPAKVAPAVRRCVAGRAGAVPLEETHPVGVGLSGGFP